MSDRMMGIFDSKSSYSKEEAEAFVRQRSEYLGERVKELIGRDVDLTGIRRNPHPYRKKNIYELDLSNGTKIILKLCRKDRVRNEVQGMNYATLVGILHAELIGYEDSVNNPFENPFLLMRYLEDVKPITKLIEEDAEVKDQHIRDSLNIIEALHTPRICMDAVYHQRKMTELFDEHKRSIQRNPKPDDRDQLAQELEAVFDFYENHRGVFTRACVCHLHGDLAVQNFIHTEDGIRLIDWAFYHIGDYAEDMAYFIDCTFHLTKLVRNPQEYIDMITERYSRTDPEFSMRLEFYTSFMNYQRSGHFFKC